jgi:hypothetical protein
MPGPKKSGFPGPNPLPLALLMDAARIKSITHGAVLTTGIYAPMIYTAPCIMFWMRAYQLRGQVGGCWALEFESFLGPVKCHRADRRVPFGAQRTPPSVDSGPVGTVLNLSSEDQCCAVLWNRNYLLRFRFRFRF